MLLCLLSVLLTLNNALTGPGEPQPLVALNVVLPQLLTDSANKLIGILVPVGIAILFWLSTRNRELNNTSRLAILLLAVQTVLAFLVAEELQFVIAVEAGLLLSTRAGCLWVVGQASAAWIVVVVHPELMAWIIPQTASPNQRLMNLAMFMLIAMLYNLLAFSLGLLAAAEGRQRRQLETVNRELRAAQQGMLETARLSERLRLSRELHDAVGHQLTALASTCKSPAGFRKIRPGPPFSKHTNSPANCCPTCAL